MIYVLSWYVVGLLAALIIDYLECKVVNSTYREEFMYGRCGTYYSEGIRPPAVWQLVVALGGLVNVAYLIHMWRDSK